jgi:hypothetical protein
MRKVTVPWGTLIASVAIFGFSLWLVQQPGPFPPPAGQPAELTLLLKEGQGSGSGIGVKVTPAGFTIVLTAKHVAEHLNVDTSTVLSGEVELPIVRIEMCPDADLAAVWVQRQLPVVPVDYSRVQFGDRVQAAGWVYGSFLHLDEGLVARNGNVSIDSYPGCSGGPVLRNGKLVGLIVSSMRQAGIPVGGPSDFEEISRSAAWLRGILGS